MKMEFGNLITSNNWLSVELTLVSLYPDQKEILDNYKMIFELLQLLEPERNDMLIVLTEYDSDTDDEDEINSTYVDVSGRKVLLESDENFVSYAIEFVKWEKWLGMNLAPETMTNFTELEIIAHCLFEMTFCGYEQEEIQEQFDSINKTIEEYKNLTTEEKAKRITSLESLKEKWDKKGGS